MNSVTTERAVLDADYQQAQYEEAYQELAEQPEYGFTNTNILDAFGDITDAEYNKLAELVARANTQRGDENLHTQAMAAVGRFMSDMVDQYTDRLIRKALTH
jgi:hypothetical protein